MKRPAIERVADRCIREDRGYATPCRIFTGAKDSNGYGMITVPGAKNGTTARAHVVTYEFSIGPVPEGLELHHLCEQRDCCATSHLRPVTHVENVRLGRVGEVTRARGAAVTHCPRGHEYTEENTRRVKHRDGYTCRACKQCHRDRMREYHRRTRAVVAASVIGALLLIPVVSAANDIPDPPDAPCTLKHRMDVQFIDGWMFSCDCEVLARGFHCQWNLVGKVESLAARRFLRRHHSRLIPVLVINRTVVA